MPYEGFKFYQDPKTPLGTSRDGLKSFEAFKYMAQIAIRILHLALKEQVPLNLS